MGGALDALGLALESARVDVPGGGVDRTCRPGSVDALAELVRAAAADGAGLLPIGGRTRLGWANRAAPLALGVSLDGLAGVHEFEPDEGVIRVGAGTRLAALRERVASEGWELPLDSPGAASTVGGTIATAVIGPRAHAFGAVKDAILGLEVVGGDGVASRCGGRVVKNVTGYDLAKLYCGSFGSLAIVTGAWLRLRPAPAERVVLTGRSPTTREALEGLQALATLPCLRALVWQRRAGSERADVTIELGGSPESVAADRDALAERLPLETGDRALVDRLRDARAQQGTPFALRARVLGSRLYEMAEIMHAAALDVCLDVGLGALHATGSLSDPTLVDGIRERAVRFGGSLRVEAMPPDCVGSIDVFGDLGGAESIVRSLKRRFDPAGILSPGRFVAESSGGASA